MTRHQTHSNTEILRHFQSKLPSLAPETQLKYARTISDLDLFLTTHSLLLAQIDETLIADFATSLLIDGLSTSTVSRHLNILNALLNSSAKAGLTPPTDAARAISRRLSDKSYSLPPLLQSPYIYKVLPYLRAGLKPEATAEPARDLLLLALLNGHTSLKDLAYLRKEETENYDPLSRGIIDRNLSPRRDFVFDLRQSYLSKSKLYEELTEQLRSSIGRLLPLPALDPDTLLQTLQTDLAIRNGARPSEAALELGYSIPDFVRPTGIPEEKKEEYRAAIRGTLSNDRPHWFALHLRQGVDYRQFRLEMTDKVKPMPEFFYPVETIRKVSRGRVTFADQPYISNICFFRTLPERIRKMMYEMGDKGWVYRMYNSPSSPYAVISDRDMARFQNAVGHFTPDTELFPAGTLTPKTGEKVVIIKPGYQGREAKVEEVLPQAGGSVIIRVLMSTEQGYEWRLDLDPRQLEPAPGSRMENGELKM